MLSERCGVYMRQIIGLKRGTVKLVRHNPKWARLFEKEKKLLKKTFGRTIAAIEHIGSTAISGISAKPILDMDIGVRSLKAARGMKEKFEKLGYTHRPFLPTRPRTDRKREELYVKGPETKRTHYAHVIVYGGDCWRNDLLFRDYLCGNPSRACEYAELKKKLAKQHPNDRQMYTKKKMKFIAETLKMARESHS